MRNLFPTMSCLLGFIFVLPNSGQTENEKLFAALPIAQRARFAARLNKYVEYLLADRLDKLLGFYDEQTLCTLCKGKQKCVKDCQTPMVLQAPEAYRSVLTEFIPIEVKPYRLTRNWHYYVEVEQQNRVSWNGKAPHIVKSKGRVFAVHENGNWYFSLVSVGPLLDLSACAQSSGSIAGRPVDLVRAGVFVRFRADP